MTTPSYDARDVLDRYMAALKGKAGLIRDAAELAHPKDVVRAVLQHCMRTIAEPTQHAFLKDAYLSLANFQELSDADRNAVRRLSEIGPPQPPGTDAHAAQLKSIGEVADPLQVVIEKIKAELAVLTQELKSLPGGNAGTG